ncbi:TonB-dependent receptor domain-containing protein [Nitratireductor kimnyeongensis]|uniref:TonB-dependent receptor domain-containing protein n=1 Tax=Nitratireductor kimnyeongensis TaxID=430679 RepID=A0ABW0T4W6_9HYPH|nr:TonB-dependent receptor [Nitratireductor kimnyeongensis]QZZ34966.1 TonB-dependent receptor [Nitratireductor kimnyeongensis]
MHRKFVVLLAASASLFSLSASAQDGDTTQLNRIVIHTTEDSPNAVDVTDADIERLNPSDLQDLFAAQPTISVGSSLPVSQKLYVQGIEETNLSVTIDGSRQNNKIFHHNATTLIDPALLKAVSIDPGVAPADAGPGALAGAVSYETMDVQDLLLPGRQFGGFLKGEYDSNGDVFTGSASAYGQSQGFEILGFLKYADGGLRTDGDGNLILGSETGLLSGLGKLAYEAPTGHRFELSYEHVKDDNVRPYRANVGVISGGRPVPASRVYDLTRQNIVFTYTNEMPEGWWDPTIQLAYSLTDLDIPETGTRSRGTTDSFNGKIENRFALDRGSVVAGIDFYKDRGSLNYQDFSDPSENIVGSESATNIGVYSQARLDLTDRMRLSFGGRADFQRFEGVNGYKDDNAGLSGNISGEFDVTSFLTASAGISRVWAGIPLAENFILNPAWDYSQGIDPVTANNVFAGLRAEHQGFWVEGKIFRSDIDNARAPSYGAGPHLQHDLRAQGYELGAGYRWEDGFLRIGYADIDAEIDGNPADTDTGRYLTTPIGQNITLEAAHTFAAWGLTVGANARFVLEETDTYNPDTGGRGAPLPAYEVVNAFVEYVPEAMPHLTLRGEVNNLFDAAYISRATYGQEFSHVAPLQEPGRSFKLSLTGRF